MEENPQGLELFIARQRRKLHLAEVWGRLAGLRPGMVVVDIGCGPRILTLEYARIAGPQSMVYGVEQDARLAAFIGVLPENVRFLFQSYDIALNLVQTADIIFLTDTLHHLDDKLTVLRRIRAACGPATKVFIAEYDPRMPGRFGAKLHRRMPKEQLSDLLASAGFAHDGIVDTEDEHYAVIARCCSG